MTVGDIISYVMLFFALIGAADRAIGCRFGPGKSFEKGFETAGPIILVMTGSIAMAPLIAKYLAPVLTPVCSSVGIDPSIIAGLLMANDSGGWPLAVALANDAEIGRFAGSIVGSTMGCAIMFAFPIGFSMSPKEKKPLVAKGLAIGLVTIPIACFVGGLFYDIAITKLLLNLLPLILMAAVFLFGLIFFESITIKIVTIAGYIMTGILTAALAATVVIKVLKLDVEDFGTFDEALLIVGDIVIFLCGAFTLLYFLQKYLGKAFAKIGGKTEMDETSVMGIITTSVNAIPMFGMIKDMNERGVVVNMAYLVPASFILGDHLAFQIAVDSSTALPLIAGKLAGGVAAIAIAMVMTGKREKNK